MIKPFLLLTLTALCAACAHPAPSPKMQTDTLAARPAAAQLRIATYNTSLYSGRGRRPDSRAAGR